MLSDAGRRRRGRGQDIGRIRMDQPVVGGNARTASA